MKFDCESVRDVVLLLVFLKQTIFSWILLPLALNKDGRRVVWFGNREKIIKMNILIVS